MSKGSVTDIDRRIGENIKIIRLSCHMTQETLGIAIGVTFQQIQKYELGKNRVAVSTLFRIASALETDVKFFLPHCDVSKRKSAA